VGLDRFFADDHLLGYLAVVHPVGDQAQRLQLALGQVAGSRRASNGGLGRFTLQRPQRSWLPGDVGMEQGLP
jgi:hypothetical protein